MLTIDPEDLQAHYNLMLCYNGLGDEAKAEAHKMRYLRFKADESAQAITGPYRQKHPEDNNERQQIHEHVSVALNTPQSGGAKSNTAQTTLRQRSLLSQKIIVRLQARLLEKIDFEIEIQIAPRKR